MDFSAHVTRKSIHDKVVRYLFNPASAEGWPKGQWFIRALGFNPNNPSHIKMLEEQILFDEAAAEPLPATSFGKRYNMVVTISGPNGKTIHGIRTGWQRDRGTDIIRLITIFPPKKW